MSKPNSPLLSLGAKGTIADALTFQKRGLATIARKKPMPEDPYSLPQAYQRWLYEDYAYLWTQQSEATKRQYASSGVRYHLTAFQYWMKYHLTNLPDILGLWHFDYITGALVLDSSKNTNNGTVFGAIIADGIIDKGLSFDGLNDYINCGTHHTLYPTAFTFEAWLYPLPNIQPSGIQNFGDNNGNKGFYSVCNIDGSITFKVGDGTDLVSIQTTAGYAPFNEWHHVAVTFDGLNMIIYVDGVVIKTGTQQGIVFDTTLPCYIASYFSTWAWTFKGILDHVIYYNRPLYITELKRHSQRRYPP